MNNQEKSQDNANPVKKLCELGICVSMAQARRMVYTLDPKRLDQIIERATKRKVNPIPPTYPT